jgi:hypothetical protein
MHLFSGPILSLCHIYDSDGNELVRDKDRDVRYTVVLNAKNINSVAKRKAQQEEESSFFDEEVLSLKLYSVHKSEKVATE